MLQIDQVILGLLADKKREGKCSCDYFGNACFWSIAAFSMLFAVNV